VQEPLLECGWVRELLSGLVQERLLECVWVRVPLSGLEREQVREPLLVCVWVRVQLSVRVQVRGRLLARVREREPLLEPVRVRVPLSAHPVQLWRQQQLLEQVLPHLVRVLRWKEPVLAQVLVWVHALVPRLLLSLGLCPRDFRVAVSPSAATLFGELGPAQVLLCVLAPLVWASRPWAAKVPRESVFPLPSSSSKFLKTLHR